MDKRTFLKKSLLLGAAGMAAGSAFAGKITNPVKGRLRGLEGDRFTLPELPYAYNALEPYIDAMTMEIHHSKHHAAYTANFNKAIAGTEYADMAVKDMFAKISTLPVAIRNNGGGFFNHKFFWKVMSPTGGGQPQGDLADAINRSFGSFEKFKELFSTAAATRFGSGWAWLLVSGTELKVCSTPNQDNPLMDIAEVQGNPILTLDVWEHAYYLKYQNKRTDYISAFWNVINWDFVAEKFAKTAEI
jgi:Fe-Mn family superoxide dismutase